MYTALFFATLIGQEQINPEKNAKWYEIEGINFKVSRDTFLGWKPKAKVYKGTDKEKGFYFFEIEPKNPLITKAVFHFFYDDLFGMHITYNFKTPDEFIDYVTKKFGNADTLETKNGYVIATWSFLDVNKELGIVCNKSEQHFFIIDTVLKRKADKNK
jgi:hypothetical protein